MKFNNKTYFYRCLNGLIRNAWNIIFMDTKSDGTIDITLKHEILSLEYVLVFYENKELYEASDLKPYIRYRIPGTVTPEEARSSILNC